MGGMVESVELSPAACYPRVGGAGVSLAFIQFEDQPAYSPVGAALVLDRLGEVGRADPLGFG